MLLSGLIASETGWLWLPDEYELAPDELCEYLSLLGGAYEYELAPDELCEYLSLLSMRFKSSLFSLSSSMA